MESRHLALGQLTLIYDQLKPSRNYLQKLIARMESQAFPDNDAVRRRAIEALHAVNSLMTEVRLLSLRKKGGRAAWRFSD